MKPARLGLLFSAPYLLYVVYCVGLAIRANDAGTQVAAAVFAYPTSQILFSVAGRALESIGPYGDPARRVAEWSLLAFAGFAQYFLLGYLVGKVIGEMANQKGAKNP